MSHNPEFQSTDKFELHYRQQLSALVDGELSADETRFLLRRMAHDEELALCQERWQLCGDVLRGAACAPAPLDFAARVGAALAAEPAPAAVAMRPPRQRWRWGGGAALAASVAVLALLVARERLPDTAASAAPPPLATTQAPDPAPALPPVASAPQAPPAPVPEVPVLAAAAVPAAALASARRPDSAPRRGAATRNQQVARSAAARQQQEPQRRVAAAAPALPAEPLADPFAHPGTLQAKPWPRATLAAGGEGGSPLSASFSRQERGATFYPFEPQLPVSEPAAEPSLPQRQP